MIILNKIFSFSNYSNLDFEKIYKILPKYRKEKIDSLLNEKDKFKCLITGFILKESFNELGYKDLDNEIILNKENKPLLPTKCHLFLNISHSNDKLLIVISDKEIGCDIEINDSKKILNVAKHIFNEKEIDFLKDKPLSQYYIFWNIKEAYLKYLGAGFNKNPLTFTIFCNDGKYSILEDDMVSIFIGQIENYSYAIVEER